MKYFAYCRKSEDDEERQVLSIPAQRDEVEKLLAKHPDMVIVSVFEESRTAKVPGRPIFNEMMKRIERGEAEGIIAWHPDRLARNSIDGGMLIYCLDRGVLKDIKFATYSFENSSQGKFMLQIMFGYSKYYVDSLSENVKRGNRRKLEQGILPNRPPIGYRNEPEARTIVVDPRTYPTIRKIWDLALTGCYTVRQIRDLAEHEWGFRTPQRKKSGGKPLATGTLYTILSNRFYTGLIEWRGLTYPGKHEPMVTLDEFERMQQIIGRPGHPTPQKHVFPYTGLIRCGTCGCAVTAETKTNRYGYRYEYYHCTRKRRAILCKERYVEREDLERQILDHLRRYQVTEAVHGWAIAKGEKRADARSKEDAVQVDALKSAVAKTERSLATLTDLRVGGLIEDAEYLERRDKLQIDAARIRQQIAAREANTDYWLEPLRAVLSFSKLAVDWFEHGNLEQRRLILASVGSNLTLSGRILSIQAAEPFELVPRKRNILHLCALIDCIRQMSGKYAFDNMISRIKKLELLASANAEVSSTTSPTSPCPPSAVVEQARAASNEPV